MLHVALRYKQILRGCNTIRRNLFSKWLRGKFHRIVFNTQSVHFYDDLLRNPERLSPYYRLSDAIIYI